MFGGPLPRRDKVLLGVNTAFFVGCAAFVLLGGSQYVVDVEPTYRKLTEWQGRLREAIQSQQPRRESLAASIEYWSPTVARTVRGRDTRAPGDAPRPGQPQRGPGDA